MRAHLFPPPVIAVWLVGFFTPDKQTEAIQGDLLEKFSRLAAASGVAAARRWYWRQSIDTVAHFMGTGLCAAPWLIAVAVLGGCLLLWFGLGWVDIALGRLNTTIHVHGLRIFWLPWGIQIGRFLLMMFVGCLVALAVRGREMVTAIALSLVCASLSGLAYPAWTIGHDAEYALPVRVFQFVSSIAILLGAAIVREVRFLAHQHPGA